jgi:hypothetical protein
MISLKFLTSLVPKGYKTDTSATYRPYLSILEDFIWTVCPSNCFVKSKAGLPSSVLVPSGQLILANLILSFIHTLNPKSIFNNNVSPSTTLSITAFYSYNIF